LAERDAFSDLPEAEEDESHGGLVVERARTGLWEPLCDDLTTKFRGPRREARLVDALSTTAVSRLVEPAVAEASRRGAASRVLLQKRLESEINEERAAAKRRFDEAEERASAERSRLTTEIETVSTKLAATERDVDDLRSSKRIVDDDLAACRRTAKDLEADVARTQSSLEETQKKLASTTDDLANAESRAGDAEASLEAKRRELRSERELGATLTQSLEQLQNRVADLDGRLKRSEDDASSAALRHGDAIEQREKELAELRRRLNESEADAAKLSDDLDELTRSNAQAQADADARNLTLMMEGASERSRLEGAAAIACASQACVAALVAKVEASQRLERREAYYSAKLLQTERKAQKAQQQSSPGLFSPFRAGGSARKLFSVGSEKIESVASSFLNLVDEELNEEESVQIPARAAATPVRDRSVPKPLRERAKEHARRSSSGS